VTLSEEALADFEMTASRLTFSVINVRDDHFVLTHEFVSAKTDHLGMVEALDLSSVAEEKGKPWTSATTVAAEAAAVAAIAAGETQRRMMQDRPCSNRACFSIDDPLLPNIVMLKSSQEMYCQR
jgi:hypothetical protein